MEESVLRQLYLTEKKSLSELGTLFGVSPKTVQRRLIKFDIPRRPFSVKGLQTRLGAKLSDETKEKIARAHRGKKLSPEHRLKVIKTLKCGDMARRELNPCWKGGKVNHNGYAKTLKSEHKRSDDSGYVYEHILIMEEYLGRELKDGEVIHHINGKKDDNRIENLALFVTHSSHMIYERKHKFWNKQSSK